MTESAPQISPLAKITSVMKTPCTVASFFPRLSCQANVLYLQNIKAHTARCEIRYRKPLEVGQPVRLKGWIESERRRLIVLKGEVRLASDDSVVADCEASFMKA